MLDSRSRLLLSPQAPSARSLVPRPRRANRVITAVAKPSGEGGNISKGKKSSPAQKASPKKKLPEDSSATDPPITSTNVAPATPVSSVRPSTTTSPNVRSQANQAEKQVDSTASSAKGGVEDLAQAAKDATRDAQSQAPRVERNVEQQADSVEDAIDAGADAAKDAVEQGKDVVDDLEKQANRTANQLQVNIDRGSEQVQDVIDDGSRRLENAIDDAPEQISGAIQQAADGAADRINETQSQFQELQKPGPKAPYQYTPLTSLDPAPFENKPGPKPGEARQAEYYKKRLFYAVSGLDRGAAANTSAQAEIEANVSSLLSVSSPVLLSWAPEKGQEQSTLSLLNGTWRLIYSSAYAKGQIPSLPGSRLGQVYQNISAYASRLDNVVELYSTVNIPQLPGFPSSDPIVTTASLKHYFEAIGGSTVKITFEDTEVKSTGGPNGFLGKLPELTLPKLPSNFRPSNTARSGTFEVLYLDEDFRITRGDRGTLRIFTRT